MHTDAERKYAAKAARVRRAGRGRELPNPIVRGNSAKEYCKTVPNTSVLVFCNGAWDSCDWKVVPQRLDRIFTVYSTCDRCLHVDCVVYLAGRADANIFCRLVVNFQK